MVAAAGNIYQNLAVLLGGRRGTVRNAFASG
jgi:hypothetical protein